MAGKIQLYSLATPNGQKVACALEELGLEYEAHTVDIMKGDQFNPEFVAINPNSKIPAIVDPNGPDGKPIHVFESGAILLYLAIKTGKLISQDPRLYWETIQWLFFQMAGVGPMFGQVCHILDSLFLSPTLKVEECPNKVTDSVFDNLADQFGHFLKFANEKCDHPYPRERYATEAKRLLGVLEKRLEGLEYLIEGGYSIADVATWPWVEAMANLYMGADKLELDSFKNVISWRDRCLARPASQKGIHVCPFRR